MKKPILKLLTVLIFTALWLFSGSVNAQADPILWYKFEESLYPETPPGAPPLTYTGEFTYWDSETADGYMLETSDRNSYMEVELDTSNETVWAYPALYFEANTKRHPGGKARWIVYTSTDNRNTWQQRGELVLRTMPNGKSGNIRVPLINHPNLIVRIQNAFNKDGHTLRMDNLKFFSNKNANIQVYSKYGHTGVANHAVPHDVPPAINNSSDFGKAISVGTSKTSAVFQIRNITLDKLPNPPILKLDSITVDGLHPEDFKIINYEPDPWKDILPNKNETAGNTNQNTYFQAFQIQFTPNGDGIRTAEILIYSDGNQSPYTLNVVGQGASCTGFTTPYVINTFDDIEKATLPAEAASLGNNLGNWIIYQDPDTYQISGGGYTWSGTQLLYPKSKVSLPHPNTATPDNYSWVIGNAKREVNFGLGEVDLSQEKDISITFNVGAYTITKGTGTGVNQDKGKPSDGPDKNGWIYLNVNYNGHTSRILSLQGTTAGSIYEIGNTSSGNLFYELTFTGDEMDVKIQNTGVKKYNTLRLNIPASFIVQDPFISFSIEAISGQNTAFWIIDNVRIDASNAEVTELKADGITWTNGDPAANGAENKRMVIPAGRTYTMTDSFRVCECEVEGKVGEIKASLTIPDGKALTVKGRVVVADDGILTVQSGGNLIQEEEKTTNRGSITVQRDVNNLKGTGPDYSYVYWSSPVEDQKFSLFSPGTPLTGAWGFLEYDTQTDYFDNVNMEKEEEFIAAKGYAIRAEEKGPADPYYSETYEFKGEPHNGPISIPIDINAGSANDPESYGFNLVGNPYPSNISAKELHDMNEDNIYYQFYFWTNNIQEHTSSQQGGGYNDYEGNNYAIISKSGGVPATMTAACTTCEAPTGDISVGQGFIVVAKKDGELNFRNKSTVPPYKMLRVSDYGPFFQKGEKDRFWLTLTSPNDIVNTTLIGYIDGATDGWDGDYDAEFWGASDGIFSIADDRALIIQGRKAPLDLEDIVPLGFIFYQDGVYKVSLKTAEGIFSKDTKVYIRDKELGLVHNLSKEDYKFYTEAGIVEDRFEIFYKEIGFQVQATQLALSSEVGMVYVTRQQGDILLLSELDAIDGVEVFDLNGRQVHSGYGLNSKEVRIPAANLLHQILFVKVRMEDGRIVNRKVIPE